MIAFARLVTHYFSHAAWLEEDETLHKTSTPRDIPAVLVHGRLDLSGPPDSPGELARAWPAPSSTSSPAATPATPRWTVSSSRPRIASPRDARPGSPRARPAPEGPSGVRRPSTGTGGAARGPRRDCPTAAARLSAATLGGNRDHRHHALPDGPSGRRDEGPRLRPRRAQPWPGRQPPVRLLPLPRRRWRSHEYTSLLEDTRRQAIDRLVQNATALGANAVLSFRFDSSELGGAMSEIVAYGTAVIVEPDATARHRSSTEADMMITFARHLRVVVGVMLVALGLWIRPGVENEGHSASILARPADRPHGRARDRRPRGRADALRLGGGRGATGRRPSRGRDAGARWTPASDRPEVFMDPSSGRTMRVFSDPATGRSGCPACAARIRASSAASTGDGSSRSPPTMTSVARARKPWIHGERLGQPGHPLQLVEPTDREHDGEAVARLRQRRDAIEQVGQCAGHRPVGRLARADLARARGSGSLGGRRAHPGGDRVSDLGDVDALRDDREAPGPCRDVDPDELAQLVDQPLTPERAPPGRPAVRGARRGRRDTRSGAWCLVPKLLRSRSPDASRLAMRPCGSGARLNTVGIPSRAATLAAASVPASAIRRWMTSGRPWSRSTRSIPRSATIRPARDHRMPCQLQRRAQRERIEACRRTGWHRRGQPVRCLGRS